MAGDNAALGGGGERRMGAGPADRHAGVGLGGKGGDAQESGDSDCYGETAHRNLSSRA
ncbi:hypothetical protein GCM10009753_06020 [Streptantibioticus ferralitis]